MDNASDDQREQLRVRACVRDSGAEMSCLGLVGDLSTYPKPHLDKSDSMFSTTTGILGGAHLQVIASMLSIKLGPTSRGSPAG